MRAFKVVVTGPRGAGKTSFIETMSETALISSEESPDGNDASKPNPPVEMDFGRITISEDTVIYLFGTQGMERFDFTWKAISEGMLGFILLVDASGPETFEEAARIMEYFRSRVEVPCVVALTRVPEGRFGEIATTLRGSLPLDEEIPVLACDTESKEEVKEVLLELLYEVLEGVES